MKATSYQSRCCKTTLNATYGTPLHRSRVSTWTWFYMLMLGFSLAAFPSADYFARHLGIDSATAWEMRRKIRGQIAQICDRGSKALEGQTVFVQNLCFTRVLSAKGRKTSPTNVLVVATESLAFAFVIPRRHPSLYRAVLDRLGVAPMLFVCDKDVVFRRIARKLANYNIRLIVRQGSTTQEGWKKFGYGSALGAQILSNHKKRALKTNSKYIADYLSEFVLRFNFAHDKAMLFPLFLSSLQRISYCDEEDAAKMLHFRRNVSDRFSR